MRKNGVRDYPDLDESPNDARFDLIRMNWSLEHVHSPSRYFSFIRDHLTEQGVVIICVPNYDGLLYRMARDCVEIPLHLHHFREKDIENYCSASDLEIEQFQTFSYPSMFKSAGTLLPRLRS